MNYHPHILYGPPGTGKTTELLKIIEVAMEEGYAPNDICFIAFTRKAAAEARDRAGKKFNLSQEQLTWFRTLHSLAFFQLALNKSQVMGVRDYINLASALGLSITFKGLSEDGTFSGLSKGDRLFFMENMARATRTPLKEYWEQWPDEDIYWYELERLHTTLNAYKLENGKADFTDIINQFVTTKYDLSPKARILIVDEAQDLTPLQWDMVDRIAENMEEVYIAGDDDQAIFRWAGADVDRFINLSGTRRVLEQSYRIPAEIQTIADAIAARITQRVPKTWKPRTALGVVEYSTGIEHIDMSTGTWLLLARNTFLLQAMQDHCVQQGYVFDSQLGSPVRGDAFRAIKTWEELRKGKMCLAQDIKNVYEHMSVKVGVAYGNKTKLDKEKDTTLLDIHMLRKDYGLLTEKIWHEALDRLTPLETEYFLAALRRGEKLLREPRIKLSTIHGVKGGEAENVVLCTDMAERTWREFEQRPDDEHRVWYVAVTRAKNQLFILNPTTTKYYQL